MSDKIVKFIDVSMPTWPCNFRCHYCYVGQHLSDAERNTIMPFKYTPIEFAKLITKRRLGGTCVFNLCAYGETLLLPINIEYAKQILNAGHFVGIVSNMTITKNINELLKLPKEQLSRLFFKCSFHYLELKRRNLLDVFVDNVNNAWRSGASITVEITPSDELEPYIDEIKDFSMKHFGALPHITVARNELVHGYTRLTKHTDKEYIKICSVFNSDLFNLKNATWGRKIKQFCYAGKWAYSFDLSNGKCYTCSHRKLVGDFGHGKHLPQQPVCYHCPAEHCFNSHAWLAWGTCPDIFKDITYANVRDRIRTDGTHWLHKRVYNAFSQKLCDNNRRYSKFIEWLYKYI